MCFFLGPARAETPPATTTRYDPYLRDALRFTATAQGSGAIAAEGCAVSINSFENLGLYGSTNTSLIYKARVGAKLNWNDFTKSEVAMIGYDGSAHVRQWLSVKYYTCEFEQNNPTYSGTQNYYITAGEYYASASAAQIDSVKIQCNYVPLENIKTTFGEENITVHSQSEMQLISLTMGQSSWGDIAAYKDIYKNLRAEASSTSIAAFASPTGNFGQVSINDIKAQISGAGLGYASKGISESTAQAEWKYAPSAGSPFYPSGNTFSIPIALRPRVTQLTEYFEIKYGKITIDTLNDEALFWPCGYAGIRGITDVSTAGSFGRYTGRHAYNYYGAHEAQVVMYLFTTATLGGIRLTSETLAKPEITRGDWAWDITLMGDTEALLGFAQGRTQTEWIDQLLKFGWAIGGLVIGACVIVGVVIFVVKTTRPMASFAARKVSQATNAS